MKTLTLPTLRQRLAAGSCALLVLAVGCAAESPSDADERDLEPSEPDGPAPDVDDSAQEARSPFPWWWPRRRDAGTPSTPQVPTRDAGAPSKPDVPARDAGLPSDAGTASDAALPSEPAPSEPALPEPGACKDTCAKAGGVDWLCKLRFMYGINYAWSNFGSDFGGNTKWNQPGVSKNPKVETELATLAQNGVDVVRWWVFPDFRGDGVQFDARDEVVGLGGTAVADLTRALELAEKNDLYLMLTLWSFDNFRPTKEADGIRARGIRPHVLDAAKRKALMEKVVRPLARAAGKSPYAKRLIAWDVINEPEWAISGPSLYGGDPQFDANPELEAISHQQMETFLADTIKVLREETRALVSVGSAAIKWKSAWSKLDTDFHQFHIYDWVQKYWPYDKTPREYGLDDRPVVMGEFPTGGLTGIPYATLVNRWFDGGYGGALSWSFTDHKGGLGDVKTFATRHPCETKY